jgi:ketosteroid isomerase-like protein
MSCPSRNGRAARQAQAAHESLDPFLVPFNLNGETLMHRLFLILAMACLLSGPALAQTQESQADHEALRKLKAELTAAVNNRDYAAMQRHMHQPFMATVITQNHFTDVDQLKDYFESLYTRDFLRMKNISVAAEADELSQIFQGTFALTKGSTRDHYELADGRNFDMDGRWTAVSIKENGEWRVLAVHAGTNFLDNPVLNAIEKSVVWFGLGGAAGGLLVGFVAGWFLKRARGGKSAA